MGKEDSICLYLHTSGRGTLGWRKLDWKCYVTNHDTVKCFTRVIFIIVRLQSVEPEDWNWITHEAMPDVIHIRSWLMHTHHLEELNIELLKWGAVSFRNDWWLELERFMSWLEVVPRTFLPWIFQVGKWSNYNFFHYSTKLAIAIYYTQISEIGIAHFPEIGKVLFIIKRGIMLSRNLNKISMYIQMDMWRLKEINKIRKVDDWNR